MEAFFIVAGLVVLLLAVLWSFKTAFRSTWNVPTYDHNEMQALAVEYQKRAMAAPILLTWLGVVMGALACGFFAPYRLVVFSVVGGLWGGITGYYLGRARATTLRARAQELLCQMRIEENTRGAGRGES